MAETATGARHSLDYVLESVYGTTPATPVFADVRHTGCTLGLAKSSFESSEIRSDRQIAHFRHGNKNVSGGIPIEMSYGSFDAFLEAVLCGTWAADTPSVGIDELKAGTTRRSFTFERYFANLTTPEYHRYTGQEFNSFNMEIKPDAIVTGNFSLIGQGYTNATTAIAGATYGSPTTTEPFDSFSGTINEGGSPIAILTGLSFTLENGLNPLFVIGSDETLQPSIGRSRLTGTITAYFQSKALLDKFVNETASDLVFTLVDAAGNQYQFDFPNIKYNGGQPDVEGEGEVTIALPFIGLYDATEASNIVIQRNPI